MERGERCVGVHVHMCIVHVIVCGQFYFLTVIFYFVIHLSGSSKRGVGIYYEVQHMWISTNPY